jgi:FkbM family methyltransferase
MCLIKTFRSRFYDYRRRIYNSWNYPKDGFIFNLKFGRKKLLKVFINKTYVLFDTSSTISKKFFFPFYQYGKPIEPNVISVFLNKIKKDSIFLDIGAYVGSYSVIASKYCTHGSIHSFEMNPLLIDELRKNRTINNINNLRIICAAVWDINGLVLNFCPVVEKDNSTNSILEDVNGSSLGVSSIRIDSYCEQNKIIPDIVKIDVEGAEVRVLKGMEYTLKNIDTLFLEIHPNWLDRFNNTIEELDQILHNFDFSIKAIMNRRESTNLSIIPIDDLSKIETNVMLLCEKTI